MKYETQIYKGKEIKIVQKEDEEFFLGCYVKTFWFPDIDKAKDFLDKITFYQGTDF